MLVASSPAWTYSSFTNRRKTSEVIICLWSLLSVLPLFNYASSVVSSWILTGVCWDISWYQWPSPVPCYDNSFYSVCNGSYRFWTSLIGDIIMYLSWWIKMDYRKYMGNLHRFACHLVVWQWAFEDEVMCPYSWSAVMGASSFLFEGRGAGDQVRGAWRWGSSSRSVELFRIHI